MPMPESGFKIAAGLTKKYAGIFYFASRFLTKEKRNAAYAVYAICRLTDEAVDKIPVTHSAQNLTELQKNIEAVYKGDVLNEPLLIAFRETVNKYRIAQEYFSELISGMYMDLEKNRYADFNELYDYCYKAAGVVGLIMLQILGYTNSAAKNYAVELGIAMQLTNILRDIKEDYARGRVYLPLDEMGRFGVSESDIAQARLSHNFKELLKFQIARARRTYQNSRAGIKLLCEPNCRFIISIMADAYAGILDVIENNSYDVFSKRAQINNFKKVAIVLKASLESRQR
jgi:phytoene synthase